MSIKTGTEGGGAFRPRRPAPPVAQVQKPLRPIENTFPEKKEFRLGQYRVIEEKDDYLVCVGFDPNAKDPLAGITPASPRTIKVAKPPALQRSIWEEGPVDVGGVETTYEYSDDEYGVRTATWTDGDSEGEQEEEQRIDIPYVIDDDVGDVIIAVEIRKSAAVDGTDFVTTDEDAEDEFRLRWMDLNVSGRHWRSSRPATKVLNVGSNAIQPFAPLAIIGASLDDGWIITVKSLQDYAATDLTYALGYGFNARSTTIAAGAQGTAIFDSGMRPLLASCEDTTLSSTDLLVMERGQAYLQKLDSSHSAIFGLFRSLREHSTADDGFTRHVVVPVQTDLFCELTASLSAPSSMIVAPATANAKLKIHNSASAGALIDGPTLKVSNRWKDLTLASGKRLYVRLDPHYGEWVIVASECP